PHHLTYTLSLHDALPISFEESTMLGNHTAQERTGSVAVFTELMLQLRHGTKHCPEAKLIGPGERSLRIVHALGHREVDVTRRGDTEPCSIDRLIDEHRDNSIEDERTEISISARLRGGRSWAIIVITSTTLSP